MVNWVKVLLQGHENLCVCVLMCMCPHMCDAMVYTWKSEVNFGASVLSLYWGLGTELGSSGLYNKLFYLLSHRTSLSYSLGYSESCVLSPSL